MDGDLVRVANTGEIVGTGANGMEPGNADAAYLIKQGVISGCEEWIVISGDGYRILDHGTVAGLDRAAIDLDVVTAVARALVVNTGTISTSDSQGEPTILGVTDAGTSDVTRNSGRIDGGVARDAGDDRLVNHGAIDGDERPDRRRGR